MFAFIGGVVVGFVAGFLVFRNNQKKINAVEAELREGAEDLKAAADVVKETVEDAVEDVKDAVK